MPTTTAGNRTLVLREEIRLEAYANDVITVIASGPGDWRRVQIEMWLTPDRKTSSDDRILADVQLFKKEDAFSIDVEAGELEALVAALTQCLNEARGRGHLQAGKVVRAPE